MAELDEAGQLYGLPLAEFTAARNELAARLRKQGDRAGSDVVKALAKPSVTAWALNQVARQRPALIEGLLAAGRELARAQGRLLAGRGQAEFREAGRVEKQAVAQVVQAAAAVLAEGQPAPGSAAGNDAQAAGVGLHRTVAEGSGASQRGGPAGRRGVSGRAPSKSALDRLEATARAAATDAAGADLLRAGRLTSDLDPTGFGELGFGLPAAPIPFPQQRRAPAVEPERRLGRPDAERHAGRGEEEKLSASREEKRRQERLAQGREGVRRLQHELQVLRKEAGDAEGEAARARQVASKADRAWAEARNAAAQAEKLAGAARRSEEDAAESLATLRARLDKTAEDLERAEAEVRELRES